jgi:hypothetical protein
VDATDVAVALGTTTVGVAVGVAAGDAGVGPDGELLAAHAAAARSAMLCASRQTRTWNLYTRSSPASLRACGDRVSEAAGLGRTSGASHA